MKRKLSFGAFTMLLMLVLFFGSCKKEVGNDIAGINAATSTTNSTEGRALESDLLKAVRQSTSRFHSTALAVQAGYIPDTHCVSLPGVGGMGYHWANPSLVDPVFDPLKPEVLLYATGPGGNLRLVAVEYIVINAGQAVPMFDSQVFMVGGAPLPIPHWTQHVWIYEHNPLGIFAPFNPNVTCP